MCGIFGVVVSDPPLDLEEGVLEKMAEVLAHRGPDACGIWRGRQVALGHTRLAIIDLSSSANQPLCNEDGSVWLVYNGEIYNFLELRGELIEKGHRFRSQTDSEVLVHLWEEEGPALVERLRGMFAFAIWDEGEGVLFLARDRMGQKPLYFASLSDRFVFASEVKSILQLPDFEPRPSLMAIHHYLVYQSVPSPYSAFEGVEQLPPAHCLLWRGGRFSVRRYWKLSYGDQFSMGTEGEVSRVEEELVFRLKEAVGMRLVSDVPLGAFLSGGIDSSMVVALMAECMDRPVKTFSIGFHEEEYDELRYARVVSRAFGTEHYELVVTPRAQEIFSRLVWHYNEPFADASAIPTFYVCQLAREHVTVVLSGDGGDENFAGYGRYLGLERYSFFRNMAHKWRYWGFFRSGGILSNIRRWMRLSRTHLDYYYRIAHFHELYQSSFYTLEFLSQLRHYRTIDFMLEKYAHSDGRTFLDATLDFDFQNYLPDTLMTKTDIASMAHSLEVRSPLLDHVLIEFVARIPSDWKLREGVGKYIFKRVAGRYLPGEIIHRRKMGFGVPLDHWFRHQLREFAYDTLLSQRAVERGYFQRKAVEDLLDRHQRGEDWQYLLWNLLMLELWHLMFVDRVLLPPVGEEG
ncbi:MAG: asparagine synthase (glutamine-hydrolyzing) [Planctomycetota bacterium]|nr:MAG: asparagine synthase (glutamine-hydrolyzing) [Planctomycetota bacterium]